ncbi:excinuclease ABC subunit B, partial [bacterium]|nr:excinuclease ABC subunit B [bacterium]
SETNRRRKKQNDFNIAHNIKPYTIIKAVHDITERLTLSPALAAAAEGKGIYAAGSKHAAAIPEKEIKRLIVELEAQMRAAAKDLAFEEAAALRDQVLDLRRLLADESDVPPWQKARLMAGDIK